MSKVVRKLLEGVNTGQAEVEKTRVPGHRGLYNKTLFQQQAKKASLFYQFLCLRPVKAHTSAHTGGKRSVMRLEFQYN